MAQVVFPRGSPPLLPVRSDQRRCRAGEWVVADMEGAWWWAPPYPPLPASKVGPLAGTGRVRDIVRRGGGAGTRFGVSGGQRRDAPRGAARQDRPRSGCHALEGLGDGRSGAGGASGGGDGGLGQRRLARRDTRGAAAAGWAEWWRAAGAGPGAGSDGMRWERRTWSRERRDYGSGGLAEFGLWRRVWDRVGVVAAGGFTFRAFLFSFFHSLFYSIPRQYKRQAPKPNPFLCLCRFFCELKKPHRIIAISLWVCIVFLCVLSRTEK